MTSPASASAPQLGGRLVLVVGPSGAGKDTLIRAAREHLAPDEPFSFPQRVVTRPPSDAEDNREADPATFAAMVARGAFTATWEAHGLRYGIPATIEADLAAGRSVVCNVSRTVVAELRSRYSRVVVVAITASPAVLAARLARRGRLTDGDPGTRLARSAQLRSEIADVTIINDGPLPEACHRFLEALRLVG